jgi:glyoxylase-like metal-dependent hydrolase (beta-lactamase superfamily II)
VTLLPKIGNIEYQLISDGISRVDGGGAFGLVPRVIWEQHLPPDEKNRVTFALNSLLIRSEGKTILVDTGYGHKLSQKECQNAGLERPEGDLLAALLRLGVKAEDIDIVINTHLHADHCGGNTMWQNDALVPTFPNAKYLIQRLEWADALLPNERTRATYLPENYQPLPETDQLEIINGDTRVTGEVRTAVARGHTRAHQVVILESRGETALFVADMSTLHYHLERLAWVTSYDVEPLESIETKRYWQQWAIEKDALIIFQHDTQTPIGRLRPDKKHFKVEPAQ